MTITSQRVIQIIADDEEHIFFSAALSAVVNSKKLVIRSIVVTFRYMIIIPCCLKLPTIKLMGRVRVRQQNTLLAIIIVGKWRRVMVAARNGIGMILLVMAFPCFLSAADSINIKKLEGIKDVVEDAIEKKKIPGAVVLVLNQGKVVYKQAFGNKSVDPIIEPMTTDTIFDLASLTKPIATGTSILN